MEDQELSCKIGPPCSLILADGSVFEGKSFGAQVPIEGEVGRYIILFINIIVILLTLVST